jgi:predicted RNA binding protein YcfA (HicA-like mRNA interferase family)
MTPAGYPVLTARALIRALQRLGFVLLRKSKGSHWQFQHPDGRRTTVPVHKGCDIGPGLLRKILRDIELDLDDLKDWL